MGHDRRTRRTAAVIAACILAAGCGGSDGSIEAVGDPVPAAGSPDSSTDASNDASNDGSGGRTDAGVDACSLVTQDDLAAVGSAAELGDGQTSSDDVLSDVASSACSWTLYDGTMNWTFGLVVERGTDSGGFEEAAADTFMDTEPEAVDGLGDAATYQEDLFLDGPDRKNRVAVLSGADVVVLDNVDEGRLPRASMIEIARRVVERLEGA